MVSELVTGTNSGIAFVKRHFFRGYVIAMVVLSAFFLTIGLMIRGDLLSKPVPATDSLISAPAPTGARLEFYVIIIPPLVMSLFMVLHLLLLKRRDRFLLGSPGQNAAKEQRENLSKR